MKKSSKREKKESSAKSSRSSDAICGLVLLTKKRTIYLDAQGSDLYYMDLNRLISGLWIELIKAKNPVTWNRLLEWQKELALSHTLPAWLAIPGRPWKMLDALFPLQETSSEKASSIPSKPQSLFPIQGRNSSGKLRKMGGFSRNILTNTI